MDYILLDIDDILLTFMPKLLEFHNEIYRIPKQLPPQTIEEVNTFNLTTVWGVNSEESYKRVHHFYQSEIFWEIKPEPGAVEGVEALAEDYALVVATSRPLTAIHDDNKTDFEAATIDQILTYFGEFIKPEHVHVTNQYNRDKTPSISKLEVAKQYDAFVIADDGTHNVEPCVADSFMWGVLYTQNWNINDVLPNNVLRVHSWIKPFGLVEAINYIDRLRNA